MYTTTRYKHQRGREDSVSLFACRFSCRLRPLVSFCTRSQAPHTHTLGYPEHHSPTKWVACPGGVVNAVVWRNVVPLMLSLLCCVVWCSGSIKAVGSLHSPCQPSTDLRPSLVFGPCGHGRTKTKRTDGHTASYAEAGKKK